MCVRASLQYHTGPQTKLRSASSPKKALSQFCSLCHPEPWAGGPTIRVCPGPQDCPHLWAITCPGPASTLPCRAVLLIEPCLFCLVQPSSLPLRPTSLPVPCLSVQGPDPCWCRELLCDRSHGRLGSFPQHSPVLTGTPGCACFPLEREGTVGRLLPGREATVWPFEPHLGIELAIQTGPGDGGRQIQDPTA